MHLGTSAALHRFLGCANAPISFGVSPLEGFGLFVVATDVAEEFAIKIFNRDEDAAGDYITLDFGKPDLNLVEPGGVGWCVMDANITISLQEFPDLGGTMSREIIGDDMNFLCRGLASNDLLEKSHELRASMLVRFRLVFTCKFEHLPAVLSQTLFWHLIAGRLIRCWKRLSSYRRRWYAPKSRTA